ncbi:MAG: hypothetical protein KAG43_07380 [Candidatus Marithrix sp.]|nr:hypothetical protein [Candidatus Marithrix sp.]
MKNSNLTNLIAVLIPIILMWIFYHPIQQSWWLADDPALLQSIIEHGIFPHFYDSDVWRGLNASNLMPWLTLSLGIDWYLFGLEPKGFYVHHLLSFSIVLLIAYIFLRQYFSALICSIVLSIFVVSVPSANIAQFLMVRHYLEGFGLSLLAILCYLKATKKFAWALLGSLFYLLATTAKEIYVPIVVILPFLTIPRWRMLAPFVAVAGGYILWRIYMLKLNLVFTSYGGTTPELNWDIGQRFLEVLGWQQTWQLVILLGFGLVLLGVIVKKYLKQTALWMVVIGLPIVPVLSLLDSRYLFIPYFLFCIGIALVLQVFLDRKFIIILISLSLILVGIKSIESAIVQQPHILAQSKSEGEFILQADSNHGILLNPISREWHHLSLQWLRQHILHLPKGARTCFDLCFCSPTVDENIYQYLSGQVKLINPLINKLNCGKKDMALQVKISFINNALHWQLGPYKQGQYYAVISTKRDMIAGQWTAITAHGSYPYNLPEKLYIAIKYDSPTGWQTYSPVLTLESTQNSITWTGPN